MEIITGILLLLIALKMRSWGRKKGMIHPLLRPFYQNNQNFWFVFSVTGILLFIAGIVLITLGFIKP